MASHRLPILADFLFLHSLLSEKSIDHQSFEAISAHIQKKFQKNDLLSGKYLGTLGSQIRILLKKTCFSAFSWYSSNAFGTK